MVMGVRESTDWAIRPHRRKRGLPQTKEESGQRVRRLTLIKHGLHSGSQYGSQAMNRSSLIRRKSGHFRRCLRKGKREHIVPERLVGVPVK